MTELLQYTKDFELYDPEKPYIKAEYRILIEHDLSQNIIDKQFSITFLDFDNNTISELIVNNWGIWSISVEDYYGRANINLFLRDPNGKVLPEFRSGGNSLSNDEKWNIERIQNHLTPLLRRAKLYSCFLDYRSRLDYVNIFNEDNEGKFEPSKLNY